MDYKEKVIALLNDQELSKEQKEKLENIFPELKESESEDEKIRKGLIKAVSRVLEGHKLFSTDVTRGEALAWLEKQGEKTHAKLGQLEATKTSDQELSNKIEPKKLDADKVIAWLEANICDFEYYVKLFKKDFGL